MIISLTAFTHKYPTIYKSDKMEWNTTDMVNQLNKAIQGNDKQQIRLIHNDLRQIISDLAVECAWDLSMFNGNNDNPHNQTLIVGDGDPICNYLHAFVQQNYQVHQHLESKSLLERANSLFKKQFKSIDEFNKFAEHLSIAEILPPLTVNNNQTETHILIHYWVHLVCRAAKELCGGLRTSAVMADFIKYEKQIQKKLKLVQEAMVKLKMNVTYSHVSFILLDTDEKVRASRVGEVPNLLINFIQKLEHFRIFEKFLIFYFYKKSKKPTTTTPITTTNISTESQ